ncbi:MAG: AbrB/MazE/SpoVT family DNA-binding domain-containing protein [Candidatus Rokubacteria bacterium]|nr:AbrB/MazE/SpoVT family DNA-binding domain-containing protein [Candidatus Rokubacteria bacterium]
MRMQIQKWGNSLALRIPKPFAEDADVRKGTVVDLSVSEGKLVVAAARRQKPALKELLAKVNRRNLHGEVDSGPPTGRGSW